MRVGVRSALFGAKGFGLVYALELELGPASARIC